MSRDTTLVPVQVPDLNSASGYRIAWLPANTPTPDTSAGERETGSYEYGSLQDRIDDATRDAAESHKEDCNSYGAGYDSGYLAALIEIRDADPPSSAGERMREALVPVYVKKWRTLIMVPPTIRDEINADLAALALQGPSGKTPGAVDE